MAWACSATSNVSLVRNLRAARLILTDPVEQCMARTDRKFYVPKEEHAYEDSPQSIGYRATISAPHMHAMAMEILAKPLLEHTQGQGDGQAERQLKRVLDVGCGSGYLASCLQRLIGATGATFAIDYVPELVELSRSNISKDDPKLFAPESTDIEHFTQAGVYLRTCDGWKGWKEAGPFDAIHVGAAAASLPPDLVEQLKPGGVMVIPIGESSQALYRIDKDAKGKVTQEIITGVRYVPLVKLD